MNANRRLRFRQNLPSRWFRRWLLRDMIDAVLLHNALPPRDLNRRRHYGYAEGLLRAWNLHSAAHGRRRLSLEAVARLASRRQRAGEQAAVGVDVLRVERDPGPSKSA